VKIVITGGTGFLGRHVAEALQAMGGSARLLGRKEGDLLDPATATRLLAEAEGIVHLAADVGGVAYLGSRSGAAFHVNHQLGLNVIAAACQGACRRLVLVGSPCSYAAGSQLPLAEADLTRGIPSGETGSYGFAKLAVSGAAEVLCGAVGIEVVTAIPSNLYGPGDHYEQERSHVVAALVRRAVVAGLSGQGSFEVWGNGSATRDFVYVSDVAAGIASIVMSSRQFIGETFNLGSGIETSIREMADLVAQAVGGGIRPQFNPAGPVGYTHRVMSIDRAREAFGYSPQTSLLDGLSHTLAWIRAVGIDREWMTTVARSRAA
jgi:GDP-L-fucose synthase